MPLSVRTKLLLGFIAVVGLSYLIQAIGFQVTDRTIATQIRGIQFEKAQNAAGEIQNLITRIERDQLGIARAFVEKEDDLDNVILILKHTLDQNEFFRKITILTTTGREIVKIDTFSQTPEEALDFEIRTTPFDVAVAGQTGISKVYLTEQTSTPQFDIFTPIFSDEGQVVGVIKGELTLERLWDQIAQVKMGTSGFAYLVDDEGRLIAHPDLDLVSKGPNYKSRKIVDVLLVNDGSELLPEDYVYVNAANQKVISNGVIIPKLNWVVIVEQLESEALSSIDNLRNYFYTTALVSVILLISISLFLSENLTRPIRKLQKTTKLLARGELSAKVEINTGDEIEELGNSINTMSKKLLSTVWELEKKVVELEEQKERLNKNATLLLRRDLDLRGNYDKLENQRNRLDQSAKLLLRRDLNLREINAELEKEKETLEAERNKLSVVLERINDGVIAVDLKRKIRIFNSAAENIVGIKHHNVIGKTIDEVISVYNEDKKLSVGEYCPVAVKGESIKVAFMKKGLKIISMTNKKVYANLTSSQIKEGTDIDLGCILTLHDVTNEKELEAMKIDFVSMAAHELRTPLTSIRGYISLLSKEIGDKIDLTHREALRRISVSADSLASFVDDLLNVSRIERGTISVDLESVDLAAIAQRVVIEFDKQANLKDLTLKFIEPKEKMPQVLADRERIAEVVSNLINNALTYTSEGGKVNVFLGRTKPLNASKGHYVSLSVKDTGVGIPEQAIPKLFTKFYRVKKDLTKGPEGTGLGLYISRSIIQMHKGQIWVDSVEGHGSTFTFSLPAMVTDKNLKQGDKKIRESRL